MISIFIQLTYLGTSVGPTFDIYSDVDSYTTPFATGITSTMLINGYVFTNVPLGTTTIKVSSVGECVNSIYLPIQGLPGCDEAFCNDNCCNYELTNNSGGLRSWSYYDCEGTEQLGIYGNGEEIRFCANKSIGPILVDTGCTLTLIGCCYDCICYTLIGESSFTIEYQDCFDVTQTQISSFNGFQYVVSYCGGAPMVISGSYNETYISGNCFWTGEEYSCPL